MAAAMVPLLSDTEVHPSPSAVLHLGDIILLQLSLMMVAMGSFVKQNAYQSSTLVQVEDPIFTA